MSSVERVASTGPDTAATGARAARHLDIAFRHVLQGPGAKHRDDYITFISGEQHPLGNVAIVSNPTDPAITEAALAALVDFGGPAAAMYPNGAVSAVVAAAQAAGFTIDASMPAMAVDIDQMAPVELPRGYHWARIGAGEDGRAWARTLSIGYEIPQKLADLFSPLALGADMAPDATIQFFAVARDGEPVATSMLYLADGLAGIYCVATVPEERGKGLGAYATAQALREVEALGYRVGVLQSSAMGHGVYRRLGFGDFGTVPVFVRIPG